MELQFINGKRQVELSSRGAVAGSTPATPEVGRAVETGKTASFSGRDPLTGESILAVSSPVFYNGTVVAVMRFVTSTRLLDQQLWLTVLVMAAVIAAVIFLIFVSNLIFINNVVQPVAEVSEAAKRISSGSYGIQIANKYTDELGQLVDNINNMSLKISQSEKMQTEFISSVSHELRTPLTAISGWGETLLGDETGDPRQLRRGLRIIVKEARRLTGMVEELLEFSKMQDGRFTLQVEEMDLRIIISIPDFFVLFDFVQWRLSQIYISLLDQFRHKSVKECQKQRRNMRAINIGIGHDDDLVITQLADIKVLVDSGTKGCDHRLDLGVAVDSVQTGFLYVEDLTTERKDCLCGTVTCCLGGTTRGITLYDVDLTVFRVLVRTVSQLARKRHSVKCRFSSCKISCLTCCFSCSLRKY